MFFVPSTILIENGRIIIKYLIFTLLIVFRTQHG